MSQPGDVIVAHIDAELTRGSSINLPYPAERGAHNYKKGNSVLKIPSLARLLGESSTTFAVEYGVQGIVLTYLAPDSIPAGSELDFEPAMAPNRMSAALTARGMAAAFAVVTAVNAAAPTVAFVSPYRAGDFRGPNPLSPVSVARIRTDGGDAGGGNGARDFGMGQGLMARVLGVEIQETRQLPEVNRTVGVLGAAIAQQEMRDLRQYDTGRIQAEIDELSTRYRDHGMDRKPQDPNAGMPMQVIHDNEGKVIMKGHAQSVEHLIAIKLEEAAKSTNPEKQVVNLAGAQLDEKTLGRKLNLTGFDLKNVDMRGANLGGAQFKDCKFENVEMTGVNLKGAHFDLCAFKNVNMNEFVGDKDTKFSNSTMEGVTMCNAIAPQIKFENIRADGVDMTGAHFAGASINNMHVNNLRAKDINLEGAKVGELHVTGRDSSFENAKMNGISVANSSFGTPQYGINMKGIQAANSNWNNVQFNASDLSGANFTNAVFVNVDMRRVVTPQGPMQMAGANLTGLEAGPDAKFKAYRATYGGVEMLPSEDFVFRGIEPIRRAAHEAMHAQSAEAHIKSADGATTEADRELEQKRIAQQRMEMQRKRNMAMAPAPRKKGDTPWG